MTESSLKVYPLEQYMHHRHPSLRKFILPDVQVVTNGRVINWNPPEALHQALTAVQDKRNRPLVDTARRKKYLHDIYHAASRLDIANMKVAVTMYPDMVVQSDEILELPDESYRSVAMIMTQMFW